MTGCGPCSAGQHRDCPDRRGVPDLRMIVLCCDEQERDGHRQAGLRQSIADRVAGNRRVERDHAEKLVAQGLVP